MTVPLIVLATCISLTGTARNYCSGSVPGNKTPARARSRLFQASASSAPELSRSWFAIRSRARRLSDEHHFLHRGCSSQLPGSNTASSNQTAWWRIRQRIHDQVGQHDHQRGVITHHEADIEPLHSLVSGAERDRYAKNLV